MCVPSLEVSVRWTFRFRSVEALPPVIAFALAWAGQPTLAVCAHRRFVWPAQTAEAAHAVRSRGERTEAVIVFIVTERVPSALRWVGRPTSFRTGRLAGD